VKNRRHPAMGSGGSSSHTKEATGRVRSRPHKPVGCWPFAQESADARSYSFLFQM
jgi:hypothetical protein